MNDVNIYLPNILGLLSGMIQVALKLMFRKNDSLPAFKGHTADVIAP